MFKQVPGAFGTAPKDTRPEYFPERDRSAHRRPLVTLADQLFDAAVAVAKENARASIPEAESLVRFYEERAKKAKEDLQAAYALLGEEAARSGGVLKSKDAIDLSRQISIFQETIRRETAGAQRARSTLELARKLAK